MSSLSFSIISSQFSTYAGLPICIFGIIGNLLNIRILYPTRSNPSSFLLFISSFFNIIALSEGLLPRILAISFNIDASSTSMLWCKSRLFIAYSVTITSLTCLCFASIDRFFLSCRSVGWRNRSKLSTAKIAVIIATTVIFASNIPLLVFETIIDVKSATGNITQTCVIINSDLTIYINYILRPVLLGILPGTILSITGWLTYRHINSITGIQIRGTFQRSLTSMILLQIVAVFIPIIPFSTVAIYQLITSSVVKSSYRLAQEALALNITNIILYISYASNFYIYLMSSSSYRRDFLQFILFWYHRNYTNNRIGTMTREQFEMNTASITRQLPRPVN
ncbi:unnamed protein product [Adineta steineri]|uniref:G-protein coupled receptors family 1 profile domain-containing protein n=1 Tax=Adineta steineri TaxID=433720 RepID=A0A815RVQ9_9BILA|nr:unnamed protein product [Adineta steineri]CAF1482188.1 unnamed protein product [Adineta steineri]